MPSPARAFSPSRPTLRTGPAYPRSGRDRAQSPRRRNMLRPNCRGDPQRGGTCGRRRLPGVMIEDGRVRDAMKVVVGKRPQPLRRSRARCIMRRESRLECASISPDLIAPKVLKDGKAYLTQRGTKWFRLRANADVLPPDSVDWKAGAMDREDPCPPAPGTANSMGQIKFSLDNNNGIYCTTRRTRNRSTRRSET